MSIRQRKWRNGDGGISVAWIVDWRDPKTWKRHIRTFEHKHLATEFHNLVGYNGHRRRGVSAAEKFARQLPIMTLQKIIAEKRRRVS